MLNYLCHLFGTRSWGLGVGLGTRPFRFWGSPTFSQEKNTITVLLMVPKSQTTTCDIEPCKIMAIMGWTTNLNWWVDPGFQVDINSITESPRNHLCTFQAMPRFRGKEKTIQILRLPAIVRPPGDLRFGWGGWDFLGMLRNFNARWDFLNGA